MDEWNEEQILVPQWIDEDELLLMSFENNSATIEYKLTPINEDSWKILRNIFLILESILPVIFFIAIARVTAQRTMYKIPSDSVWRYFLEFVIIILPTVIFVIIQHEYIYAVNIVFAISVMYALYKIYKSNAQKRRYITGGRRPFVLTLYRSTIYIITSICILAEDFECFPIFFESRYGFGVGLKDALVGFYVFSMAAVERNTQKWHGFKQTVKPLLLLGVARIISIKYFSYIQNEFEYGRDWNVFLTLAVTKCVGTLYCTFFKSRRNQLLSGVLFIILHQLTLWICFNEVIMNPLNSREGLLIANREGFLSLPGFMGLYLISVCIGRCLRKQFLVVNYSDIMFKLKTIGIICLALWLCVISCAFTMSISRVSCNLGYVVWILAMSLTITFVFMVVFHLVINTLWFIDENETYGEIYYSSNLLAGDIPPYSDTLPVLVEAINKNGFLFFVLTILSAHLNVCLDPIGQDRMNTFVIIFNSMFLATGIVSLIHHYKLRIAL